MPSTECRECKRSFSKVGNLRAHVKRKHPDKLNILAPKKVYATVTACTECNNTFVNTSNLNAHIRTKHPDLIKSKTQCEICKIENKKSSAFCPHLSNQKNTRQMTCSLCRVYNDSSKANLLEHYKEVHEVKFEYEEVALPSFDEFLLWKQKIERDTQTSYVTMHGASKTKSHTLIRYSCHRSGEFRSKGNNKRKLKRQGSNKIDAFCPASMKVTIQNDRCEVVFQKTHVGHRQELKHLFLSTDERQKIATEIASKVPFDTILERVRNSVTYSQSPRLHFLTKQDLYNIQKSLHLNKDTTRHSNSDVNSEGCVNEDEENATESDLFIDTDHKEMEVPNALVEQIIRSAEKESSEKIFLERKNQVVADILDVCESVSTPEELNIIEENLESIRKSLQRLKLQETSSVSGTVEVSAEAENHIQTERQVSFKKSQ